MRIIVKFEKSDEVKFVSHLDVQRLFQRAFRRAHVPLKYSQGFNPHPIMSFATALSVGYTSNAEWLEIETDEIMSMEAFPKMVNEALPDGFKVLKAVAGDETQKKALTALMYAAEYTIHIPDSANSVVAIQDAVNDMLIGEIVVLKKTKSGMKNVDIRPLLRSINVTMCGNDTVLKIVGYINASGSLSIDLLLGKLFEKLSKQYFYHVNRDEIYSESGEVFPRLEAGTM